MNEIWIRGLQVPVWIGVPDEERASPQEILIDVCVEPPYAFSELGDDITRTIDYAVLAQRIHAVASERPRRLIETLADELAEMTLREFSARSVVIEIRKFILPSTDHVAVRCRREAPASPC